MIYRYLLDTNIVSDLVKYPRGRIAEYIAEVGQNNVCTSIIVRCELKFGALKKDSLRLLEQVDRIFTILPVLSLRSPIELYYATIRTHLERSGTPIGNNDLLIAAHARTFNLILVTNNTREFDRVPNLTVGNWLQ
jgi:tRNA(fMet)-specific endonuclease VapC